MKPQLHLYTAISNGKASIQQTSPLAAGRVLRGLLAVVLVLAAASGLVLTRTRSAFAAPLADDPCGGSVVLNINDDGCGSLRQTVADAPPGSTVTFSPILASQTIILTNLAIDVTKTVTIDASAAPGFAVSGNGIGSIFETITGTTVTFIRISMVNGKTPGYGAAVNAQGNLVLIGTQMSNNHVVVNGLNGVNVGNGGAVAVNGSLVVSGSTFANNTASVNGGALSAGGALSVTNSVFLGNVAANGGAISYVGSDAQVVNSLFARNGASTAGDALYVSSPGPGKVRLVHNTIASPSLTAGAAVYVASGNVGITNTLISSHATGVENVNGTVNVSHDLFFNTTNNLVGTIASDHLVTTCNAPYFVDPVADNYHLANGSAAIDAGVNAGITVDIDGNVRPTNGGFDIGYDETSGFDVAACGGAAVNNSPSFYTTSTQFTASVASGTNVAYTWDFGNGNVGIGITPTHIYGSIGTFTATVTATTSANRITATTPVTISDGAINGLTATNSSPTHLDSATDFTASVANGTKVSYAWNFGDGGTGTGTTPSHTYASLGSYTATVTATNGFSTVVTSTTVVVLDVPISGLSATNDGPTRLGDSTEFIATILTGTHVTYAWGFADGLTGSGPRPIHTYASTGTYLVIVTVTNSTSVMSATTSVVVSNAAPIADAGGDQSVIVGTLVQLNGSGSTDPDNHVPLVYGWTQIGGTSVVLSSNTALSPTFIAPATRVALTFRLVVTDALGLVTAAPDTILVNVDNAAVRGLSAVNSSPTILGNATHLTASVTSGTQVAYTWDFGDGQLGSGITQTHPYAAVGVYTAVVTATNPLNTLVAQTPVTVTNVQPVANAGLGKGVVILSPVQLDGSGSFDPDHHMPLSYLWSQTGGPVVTLSNNTAVSPTFTAPATPALLTFTLQVTDVLGLGSVAPSQVVVVVDDSLVAGLSAINNSPIVLGSATQFTAAISAGSNVTYAWDFGNGQTGVGATPTHVYGATGTYTAVVTASNSAGRIMATTSVTVTNAAPVANAGPNQAVLVGVGVALDGSASTDSDNHLPLSYAWTQVGGIPVTLSDAAAAKPSFTAPSTPAQLTFHLALTDARGLASLSSALVTVTVGDVGVAGLSVSNNGPAILGDAIQFAAAVMAGSNVVYTWDFGDGQTGTGPNPVHTYLATGTFNAVVVARNSTNELSATTFATVVSNSALNGTLTTKVGPTLITYTLVLTNEHASLPMTNVMISGSVPAQAQLVFCTNAILSASGGDYDNGFVRLPAPVTLAVGQSVTLTWTVRPNPGTRSVVNRGHATGKNASIDLSVFSQIYGIFLPALSA